MQRIQGLAEGLSKYVEFSQYSTSKNGVLFSDSTVIPSSWISSMYDEFSHLGDQVGLELTDHTFLREAISRLVSGYRPDINLHINHIASKSLHTSEIQIDQALWLSLDVVSTWREEEKEFTSFTSYFFDGVLNRVESQGPKGPDLILNRLGQIEITNQSDCDINDVRIAVHLKNLVFN